MITDVPLKRWVVIYPKKLTKETETFSKILLEVCEGMNYEAFSPKFIEIPSDRIDAYTTKVEEIKGMEPRLIMIILSTAASDKYAAIKRQTCIDACIPTQIILGKTITPKPGANPSALKSVATKVAIQLNCKLGGAPWSIKFPVQGIMCIGVDIIRDTKNRNQFYASLIASMDITKKVEFFSHIMKYQNHAELSSNITYGFFEALKAFKAAHGSLPEKIILYRDGVGEGDISDIFHDEIPQLKSKVNDWYDNYEKGTSLKMSYIIVNKRINTKIFREQGTKLSNPLPGSIVDNTITLPER
jgi:aubergine